MNENNAFARVNKEIGRTMVIVIIRAENLDFFIIALSQLQ